MTALWIAAIGLACCAVVAVGLRVICRSKARPTPAARAPIIIDADQEAAAWSAIVDASAHEAEAMQERAETGALADSEAKAEAARREAEEASARAAEAKRAAADAQKVVEQLTKDATVATEALVAAEAEASAARAALEEALAALQVEKAARDRARTESRAIRIAAFKEAFRSWFRVR